MKISHISKTVASAIIIFLILMLAAYGLIATNFGTRISLEIAKHFVPGTLNYASVEGKLIDRIKLTDVHYQNQDLTVTAKQANLSWDFQQALAGKLVIKRVDAETVNLIINKKSYAIKQLTGFGRTEQQQFIFSATAKLLHGIVNTQGSVEFTPTINWTMTGQARNLQTKEFSDQWPATVNFDFASQGQYKNYAIQITNLSGNIGKQPIAGQIKLALAENLLTKVDVNLKAGNATLQATGKVTDVWDLNWRINIPDLALIAENAGGDLLSSGHISGKLKQPNIKANINATDLIYQSNKAEKLIATINFSIFNAKTSTITANADNAKFDGITIKQLQLTGSGTPTKQLLTLTANTDNSPIKAKLATAVTNKGLTGNLTVTIPKQPALTATVILPNYQLKQLPDKNQAINGSINWQTTDLSLLSTLYPQLIKPTGKLQLATKISGTLGKPLINGKLILGNASAQLPARQITIKNINITANFDATKVNYNGELTSGDKVIISGETKLERNFPTSLTIKGKYFLASDTSEFQLYLSPDLTINSTSERIDVTGDVTVPKALIEPHEFTSANELPDDVVFVDQDKVDGDKQPESPIGFYTNINLIAGDDVNIGVKGLTGRLEGKVNLQSTPTTATVATGQLNIVDGKFSSRGAELKVEQGQLIFTNSPITNPAINVRATKTVKTTTSTFTLLQENIIVGIAITGRVKNPKIKLFSEPPGLSQADILSYIVLGQALKSANKSSIQLLVTAANALDVGDDSGGISKVISDIKSTFGLSEIGFETEPIYSTKTDDISQNTALVLGKYLSPKLYVQYSIGLLDPINTLRLRYSLSKKWSIQSESSTLGTGADILYTIER